MGTSAPTAMVRWRDVVNLGEAACHYGRHVKGLRDLVRGSQRAEVALQQAEGGITGGYSALQEAEGGMKRGSVHHL